MPQKLVGEVLPFGALTIKYDSKEVYPPSHYAENFLEIISKQNFEGLNVLDVGCGTGVLGIAAAKLGATVTCTDLNPKALEWAEINAKGNDASVETIVSDGVNEFQANRKFDVIICNPPSNPGYVDNVITPTDNGPLGRDLLDKVIVSGGNLLNAGGKLLSCSNSEQNWQETKHLLDNHWANFKVVNEYEESFSGLAQFPTSLLESWVNQGLCWKHKGEYFHSVRYFFAYK